jgi:HK97 family phage prohead protease
MKQKATWMRSVARPRTTPDGFEPGEIVSRKAVDDLSARFAPSSYNPATRTVEAIFSAGTRVSRWGVFEELEVSAEAIDLSRVALGQVRLLDTHNQNSLNAVLGVVEEARIEGGNLVGRIRFADTEAGRNAEGMVARGEITGISVGYRVTTWVLGSLENEVEVWRAARWELLEVSLVAVPADPQASIRSTTISTQRADDALSMENDDMRRNAANSTAGDPAAIPNVPAADATRTAPAPVAPVADVTRAAPPADMSAERARSAEILTIGTRAAMSHDDINSAITSGTSVDVFRARAFDAMASAADRTRSSNISVGQDETETRLRNMTDAFAFRLGGARALGTNEDGSARTLSGEARAFTGFTLAEMASTVLGARSMPRTSADREDVLRRAMHTTSDFPVIFESTLNRVLASRYHVQTPTYRAISARRSFRDFRPHDQVRVGDFPSLKPVGESGEIKFGSFGDSKETVAVAPYAIQFAISRRMLIDDNIGAIDQVLGSYGDGVARFEENTFYAMKALNAGHGPTLNEGKAAVFDAAKHFNVAAAGSDVNADALSLGRAAMRKQKNSSGALLNARPRILLVGADQETNADRAVAVITPTAEGDVNPFGGKLSVVVGPYDGDAWELYASPDELPVWVWGMLDGYEAPRMRIENPFGVQGVGVSLEHDFGCGAIDFRGGYQNPGE